ncbi:hypothetical protein [Streptomyces sp. ICBB 8177]|uniref:hypothetical protein n=1 Tax=Streptomyces sp. ICBB 8177 TaxID=563922 RepID=UPI000D678728|nr:hypothetical protein [Streptomyces sp. ICBB 8177]PWI45736.1 hypothetical protein CK485_00725 [Streptomyces sp. ICBB 8177]
MAVSRPGEPAMTGAPGSARVRRGVAALLIVIPAVYLVISGLQSHSAATDKELRAQMAGVVHATPSAVQCGVYEVPIPRDARDVEFYEANSWQTDSLYVRFTTGRAGLAAFLAGLGSGTARLHQGTTAVRVPAGLEGRVGWRFPSGHRWAGTTLTAPDSHPAHEITVNLDDPRNPVVFVVATIRFPHHGLFAPVGPTGPIR